jgi:hypothetical protein
VGHWGQTYSGNLHHRPGERSHRVSPGHTIPAKQTEWIVGCGGSHRTTTYATLSHQRRDVKSRQEPREWHLVPSSVPVQMRLAWPHAAPAVEQINRAAGGIRRGSVHGGAQRLLKKTAKEVDVLEVAGIRRMGFLASTKEYRYGR